MSIAATLIAKLKGFRGRRALVVSAGGGQSGIQAMYLGIDGDGYEIYSKTFLPYPQNVGEQIAALGETQNADLNELAALDHKVSTLLVEAAKNALANISNTGVDAPHYVILNKPVAFKGEIGGTLQQTSWEFSLGDEQYVASALGLPVISGFLRHNVLAGGTGLLPTFPGNLMIAQGTSGVGIFVNIGIVTRVTVIDKAAGTQLFDTDVGPGTAVIDLCARDANCPDGFDRDGAKAREGKPDAECLEILARDEWLQKPTPKQATPNMFTKLYSHPCLKPLSAVNKLATVTALTAKCIYDFYRREYREENAPEALWVSGGAVNNLALMDYLKASFDPVPVRGVEELSCHVPPDMKIPLTLGLTVDAHVGGKQVLWESGDRPKITSLGRWTFP